ncbi:MAG: hypothetical protein IJK97_04235 [Thermoguttaceae bacterium]|nr:hypothetical protein [Thermoguttaceae bacterium]
MGFSKAILQFLLFIWIRLQVSFKLRPDDQFALVVQHQKWKFPFPVNQLVKLPLAQPEQLNGLSRVQQILFFQRWSHLIILPSFSAPVWGIALLTLKPGKVNYYLADKHFS